MKFTYAVLSDQTAVSHDMEFVCDSILEAVRCFILTCQNDPRNNHRLVERLTKEDGSTVETPFSEITISRYVNILREEAQRVLDAATVYQFRKQVWGSGQNALNPKP